MKSLFTLTEFRAAFDDEFIKLMSEQSAWATSLDPLYAGMLDHLTTLVTRGGKRLRPYLMYLSLAGYGAEQPKAATLRLTASQELYHNAWLIHDDFIDRDLTRHGGPNIAGLYQAEFAARQLPDAEHTAASMALLAGDLSLALAAQLLLSADLPAERVVAASRRLQAVSLGETGGEMLDVLMPTIPLETVTTQRLLQVYRYKTAAYSFELPLHIGAILAGAPATELEALTATAMPLGIAFQVVDDLLGTFADEQQLGKPVLSDLREGKRTILLLNGLELAAPAQKERLLALVGDANADKPQLAEFRHLLETCGARAKTEAFAREQLSEALAALASCSLSTEARNHLRSLAEFVVSRSI